jgi:subtilisin family serine protease
MLRTASVLLFVSIATYLQAQQPGANVIITTPKPYSSVVAAIQQRGGSVKAQYKYVNAIAATIPSSAMPAIRDLVGEDAITEDSVILPPRPASGHGIVSQTALEFYASATVSAGGSRIFNSAAGLPQSALPDPSYFVNLKDLNVQQLQKDGITGKGVIVAVIDDGVRPGYFGLDSDGSVIGGENFVDGDPPSSFSSPTNGPHGTFVSTVISGNALLLVPPSSAAFIASMNANFPGTLQPVGNSWSLPLIGSAPEASIYAMRVFGADPLVNSTSVSRIITAIERVITLRTMYNQGIPGGVNIQVCNLSLGTDTIYAGNTPLEQSVDALLANDIVPVVAAGDSGPSSLTITSPGTAFKSLTVGATSPAANERLWRDMSGMANALARPSSALQTAYFSARGPSADGRSLPDVLALGYGVMSQGCGGVDKDGNCLNNVNSIDVSRGTSFSAPLVAGVAALLRQKFPKASAGQIWNAIVNGADDSLIKDGSTVLDQGQGIANAGVSASLLDAGKVSDQLPTPPKPNQNVPVNIQRNTDLHVDHGTVKQSFKNLKPGQRGEILYEVQDNTRQLTVDLSNVKLQPPDQQNPLFGDDVFFFIHSAKTTSRGFGDYFIIDPPFSNALVIGDRSFVIPNPEPGVVRITLLGDETNAGTVSADVMVTASVESLPKTSTSGTIRGGDTFFFFVDIPAGVKTAQFQLRWSADWDNYPTNDLDMYVFDPSLVRNGAGATLNSPENTVISNPTPGTWAVAVQGFAVPTGKDKFDLSVVLDGNPVKIK